MFYSNRSFSLLGQLSTNMFTSNRLQSRPWLAVTNNQFMVIYRGANQKSNKWYKVYAYYYNHQGV
jgi:hypothetical protein